MVFTEMVATLLALALLTSQTGAQSTTEPVVVQGAQDDVDPFLLVAAWGKILRMGINGSNFEIIHTDNDGGIIAVDYHYRKNLIFYVKEYTPGLFSIPLLTGARGAAAESMNLGDTQMSNAVGLTVDWINDKVYWTDKGKDTATLEMYDIETQTSKVIVQFEGSDKPQGLSIFPYTGKGWLFVMIKTNDETSQNSLSSKLMRITDDGTSKTILRDDLCASIPTIDHIKRKLYWIEECGSLLEEAELDATSPRTMAGSEQSIQFSRGLGQYGDECYYTQAEKVVRNGLNSIATTLYNDGQYKTLSGLVVVHPSKQPPASDLVEIDVCPPSCGNGLCVPPGKCSCQPGWTGETCNQAVDTTQAPSSETIPTEVPTTRSTTTQQSPTTQPSTTTQPSPTTQPPSSETIPTEVPTTRSTTTQQSPTTQPSTTLPTTSEPVTETSSTVSSSDSPTTSSTSSVASTLAATTSPTTAESKPTTSIPLVTTEATTTEAATTNSEGATMPEVNTMSGLEAVPEGTQSSMTLIIIAVCTVVFLLILVSAGGYIFLVIFRYHRKRRGSYNVRKRRRESALLSPTSPSGNYRGFTEYHPSAFARGEQQQSQHQGMLTGSLSVDSFERMSIGSPLVEPCRVQVSEAEVQLPVESIRFEVTEAEIQPLAAATVPEVVVVGTNDSNATNNRRQNGHGTLYVSEQTEMYFSL